MDTLEKERIIRELNIFKHDILVYKESLKNSSKTEEVKTVLQGWLTSMLNSTDKAIELLEGK